MNKKKINLIFFDLYIQHEVSAWKDVLMGSFSIPENKLSEISSLAICEYIRDHLSDFTDYYEFSEIMHQTEHFKTASIQLKNVRAILTISNIHRV